MGQTLHQFVNLSAFAEEILAHENAFVAIRRGMPFDRAALLGCAVVTGVGAAIHTAGGLSQTIEAAFGMLRRGGTATVAGMMPIGVKISIEGFALLGERRLQGSNMGSGHFPIDIPRYVDLYLQGRLNPDDLVARCLRLDEIGAAFDHLRRGETARSIIMFPD